ncbi:MAG TPA: DUF3592 domain-containing protein [Bryobacteraceae bacterium]|jgi:hypothetical protein
MNGFSLREPQVLGALAAAGLCVGGAIAWSKMRKRPTEEELERQRRQHLVKSGRIMDGTILDISDVSAQDSGRSSGMQLILYTYEIAGVVYESSQDVTDLKDRVNIYECRLSFPCSVRYDPRRPVNSIIVAETWSGLRDTANSVPVRAIPRKPRTVPVQTYAPIKVPELTTVPAGDAGR